MPQNNFQIFNENNNQYTTMSDEEYASLDYRLNGLIPMIADPIAHNKMYRQWSIMAKAIANMICDKGYNALDTDVTDLKNNLKTSVKGLARDELQSDITTNANNITTNANNITTNANNITALQTGKADIEHTHLTVDITDITATSTEINTLHGITASTAELNYSTGLTGNIQQQINEITGVMSSPFPTWNASTSYAVGDICIASNFKSYQYLECVVAGTTGATMPAYADVGQLVIDNEVKWLVCDFRDSAPVGTIKQDLVKRDGWLKLNGATVNVADYPRLVSFLTENSLIQPYATYTTTKFKYGDSNNETLRLPNFESLFIENSNSLSNTLNEVSAGLPNITASCRVDSPLSFDLRIHSTNGAMSTAQQVTSSTGQVSGSTETFDSKLIFDASRSNSIYGNSTTVQPPAVKLIPIIKY